jgi:hypothetical protein
MEKKYRSAIETVQMEAQLAEMMTALGLDAEDRTVFSRWLVEEAEALKTLNKEVPEETLRMEYYQRLEELDTVS